MTNGIKLPDRETINDYVIEALGEVWAQLDAALGALVKES